MAAFLARANVLASDYRIENLPSVNAGTMTSR